MMPLTNSRLMIRADAGPRVGTGHVMRMLALGQAYRKRGGEVTFVIGDLPQGLRKRLEVESFQLFRINHDQGDHADAIDTREIAALVRPDWIALDGYRFTSQYQNTLRRRGSRLLVMDDWGNADPKYADLIVNQNAYARPETYPGSGQNVLAGVEFAMLRHEFLKREVRRKTPAEARRILVTFGGADEHNWTLRALQVLSDLNRKKLVVDCVVGSCYPHLLELDDFKRHARMNLRIHRNVDRMSVLMHKADLAISAGGSTCYELARCGVPAIVASIADNQLQVAEAMNELGIMESVDAVSTDFNAGPSERTRRLGKLIRGLLDDGQRRKQMSEIGRLLVDGKGAQRVITQMASQQQCLRSADAQDAERLWRWRNDPEVRAVSFQQQAIPLDDHRRWLAAQLGRSDAWIWIAESRSGDAIGNVRFVLDASGQQATISIVVDPKYRNRGVGAIVLEAAIQKLFKTTSVQRVLAQVKPCNQASIHAFRAAGFTAIEPSVEGGKMAFQFVRQRGPFQLCRHRLVEFQQLANRRSA